MNSKDTSGLLVLALGLALLVGAIAELVLAYHDGHRPIGFFPMLTFGFIFIQSASDRGGTNNDHVRV